MTTSFPGHIEGWIQLLDHTEPQKRMAARQHLIDIGADAIDDLLVAVRSLEGRKCWESLQVLAEIDDPRALHAVSEALLLPHPLVGHTAARILEGRADAAAAQALILALFDCEVTVQMRIITALGAIQRPEAIPPLLKLLQETTFTTIRYTTIEALIRLNAVEALPLILSFAEDENHHVRERVEMAIRHFQGSDSPHQDHT